MRTHPETARERFLKPELAGDALTDHLPLKPKGRSAVPHKAKDRHRARDHHPDHDRHHHHRHDQANSQADAADDDRSALRKAFGAAAKKQAEAARDQQAKGTTGEGARGGRGGESGESAVRRRQRTRRRDSEIALPEDRVLVPGNPSPESPEPHWTEMPLADKFHAAARDRDDVGGETGAGGRRIKPSRAARGKGRGDDDKDFERER